jgi:hypothetical protein
MTFQEIRIIATGPCIANQLRDVNNICRRSWYIAAHIWKVYDFKIEVVPFIIWRDIVSAGRRHTPFLADLFFYSYESEFLQKLVKDKKIHEARAFNFTYRYIDDVTELTTVVKSRYKSKNDADEAVSVVSLTSRSGGYINGRNSANVFTSRN